jgi:DNA-binding NtrC family response regulator
MDAFNPPEQIESPVVHDLQIHRVLLVDDDVLLLEAFQAMLEMNDYRVSTATNGVEALKIVMREDVDVIICDLMMPTMPGDMFYLAVERTRPQLCRRFVFVTGYENDPKFGPFLKRIEAVVLKKPVTMDRLLQTVYRALTQ